MKKIFSYLTASLPNLLLTAGFVPLSQFQPLENTTNSPILTGFYTSGNLPGLINAAFQLAISIGAILAVLRLAQAGFLYMGSADMWGEKARAKEIIRDAIVGLLLLLSIYIILYQVNPNLVNLNILQNINSGASSAAQTSSSVSNP